MLPPPASVDGCWPSQSGVADQGRGAVADRFDGFHELRVRQRGRVHLKRDPRYAAQRLTVSDNLLRHFVRAANQQRALWTSLSVEARTCHGRPAALPSNVGYRAGIARKKVVGSLLPGVCDVARRMDADLQSIGCVPLSPARFSIEIDERPKSPWLAADNGDHQRKSQRAGASKRLRGPPDTQPDR